MNVFILKITIVHMASGTRGEEKWWRQNLFLVPTFGLRRLFLMLNTLSIRSRRKVDRNVKLLLNFIDCYAASNHLISRLCYMALSHRGSHKPRLTNRPFATGFAVQSSCHFIATASLPVRVTLQLQLAFQFVSLYSCS